MLQDLVNEGSILEIDRALAEWMVPEDDAAARAVVLYLSAALREGKTFVEKKSPGAPTIFPKAPHLQRLIENGWDQVPNHFGLVRHGERLYFKRHFEDEQQISAEMERIEAHDVKALPDEVIELLDLNEEQKKAAAHILSHPLTIVRGGPGCGKTTTSARLIRCLKEKVPTLRVALAAPTGKGAIHLERSIGLESVKGKTLHSLLKEPHPLPYDLIFVDECSMIDQEMMARFLAAVKRGCRLVLLGDPDQLPPVGSGAPFTDFVERGKGVCTLEECHRTELKEILSFAKAVREGNKEEALEGLVPILPLPDPEEIVKKLAPYFERKESFQLLSPIRGGRFGVDRLNQLFLDYFVQKWDQTSPFVAPIMIAENSKMLDLANGQVGVVVQKRAMGASLGDYALFGEEKVPLALLPKFEWAWCLSVHKSQGSEFDRVVLLVPEGSEGFGRKLIYTGATRARRSLELWGEREVIERALDF